MKIKFKTGISGASYNYGPGDVVDFEEEQAIRFCEAGIARPVKEKDVETAAKDENNAEVEQEYPKHTGGGWYELSNGEKIQGKEEAIAAEDELMNRGD